jgi:hypothetical protein
MKMVWHDAVGQDPQWDAGLRLSKYRHERAIVSWLEKQLGASNSSVDDVKNEACSSDAWRVGHPAGSINLPAKIAK